MRTIVIQTVAVNAESTIRRKRRHEGCVGGKDGSGSERRDP